MTKFLVAHKACHDGLAGAWVAKQFDPSLNVFFSSRKHEWKDHIHPQTGDFVYFVDFSPNPEDLHHLIDQDIKCMVLDHHDTDVNKIKNYDTLNHSGLGQYCNFDMTKAGCLVAWDYFFKDKPYPKLLEYISIADIWAWRDDRDHAIVQYMRTLMDADATLEQFEEMLNQFDEEKFAMLGQGIYKRVQKDAKHMAKRFCIMDFDGVEVAAVNGTLYHSEVGHELSLVSPSGIGVVFSVIPESNTIKVSARGDKANKFAEKYGGGGHPQAAGFYMDIDRFNKYLVTAKKNVIMEVSQ